jgi:hypothetical protein
MTESERSEDTCTTETLLFIKRFPINFSQVCDLSTVSPDLVIISIKQEYSKQDRSQ